MSHLFQATAWTLIHFCWQAAAIAAVYRLLAAAMAHRPSHVRYLFALAALLAMLAAAGLTFAWQVLPGSQAKSMSTSEITGEFPRVAEPGMDHFSGAATTGQPIAERIPSFMLWIDSLWLVGVFGLSLRNLGGWWVIQRLRVKAAKSDIPEELRSRFTRIAAALGVHKPVLLRVSDAIAGPVTIGALRLVVLLPLSALTGLGPDELDVVLAHELAHVRRADFAWNLVQTVVETLFFFHPAVWWISARVRHERELCCDDLALQVCPNPVVYASALLHLEQQRSRQLHLAMALDGHQTRQNLLMRVARILGEPGPVARRIERPFSLAAVFAGALVVLLSAPQVIASLRPPHATPTISHAAAGPAQTPPTFSVASAATRSSASPILQSAAPKQQQKTAEPKDESDQAPPATSGSVLHQSYIDRMKAAGYDVDLDKLIAMKIQDVTPEYAHAMSQVGLGKPSADDLIACKIQGVSPEVIAQLKQQGLDVKSFQDAISFRIFEVTPEFVSAMKSAGFGNLDSKQLVALRVQGVTPEYARSVSQQFPGATADDLIQTRIFNIDADFIASAKRHGFNNLTLKKLVQLRISGLLDDDSK